MNKISFVPGAYVKCDGVEFQIQRVIDSLTILAREVHTGRVRCLSTVGLLPLRDTPSEQLPLDVSLVGDMQWLEARRKFEIVKPAIASSQLTGTLSAQLQREYGVSRASLFRWRRAYEDTNNVSALRRMPNSTKGTGRLDPAVEVIIAHAIDEVYQTKQQHRATVCIRNVQSACSRAGLTSPSDATVRRRIHNRGQEENMKRRAHRRQARDEHEPRPGHYSEPIRPMAVWQIDHQLLDVICVDAATREPIGRPWLTLAIDCYSRAIAGYYIGYEGPGVASVGMCMSTAILRKEPLLERLGIAARWPVWGVPATLHSDNGPDFHSRTLLRACEEYGIIAQFRPVKRPSYGAHIERAFGTLSIKVHSLPGSTFSNVQQRGDYKSIHKSAMTLAELEKWFACTLCDYHNRPHRGLGGATPLQAHEAGLLDAAGVLGAGLPDVLTDEAKVRFDWMPAFERKIAQTGVEIQYVRYYHDALRPYLRMEPAKRRPLHTFRRDPRDISAIYFYDTYSEAIVRIPYANTSRRPMTAWQLDRALQALADRGVKVEDESQIFEAVEEAQRIVESAVKQTRKVRRQLAKTGSLLSLAPVETKQQAIIGEAQLSEEDAVPLSVDFSKP